MSKKLFFKFSAIILIIILLNLVYRNVVSQSVSLVSLFSWLFSLALAIYLVKESINIDLPSKKSLLEISLLVILSIISLSFFALNKFHYHYDIFITAYTSYSLPSFEKINWFGVVPGKGEWVNQFPLLFHLFQNFFFLFGPTKNLVFISTLPYTLGMVILVYLFTRDFFEKRLAFIATTCFIFFAPQLYLGSIGLHFHSSSFFFLLSLYSFLKLKTSKKFFYSLSLGLSMAASYLTYTASYIVAPLILFLSFFSLKDKKRRRLISLYLKAWFIFFVSLFPILVYALRVDLFFLQRINQVNVFTGDWRSPEQIFFSLGSMLKIISKYLQTSLKALVIPGLSGAGEYWFGQEAFFEPLGFILFLLGTGFLSYKMIKKFHLPTLAIFTGLISTFILAMVFTLPPPPFHRWSLSFPLLSLIIGQGIAVIFSITKRLGFKKAIIISFALLFLYSISNFQHTQLMIKKDTRLNSNDVIYVTEYIAKNIPSQTPIYIIAFPSNAFGKELLFRLNNTYPTTTNYYENLLLPPQNALLIVHRPNPEIIQKISSRFQRSQIISDLKLRDYLLIRI